MSNMNYKLDEKANSLELLREYIELGGWYSRS
jgi:hypothetical protein